MERVEAGIGRYLPGFRHYENYNNYSMMFPDSTIDEYRGEMNRQVELAEFISITRQAVLEEVAQPDFMFKNRLEGEEQKLPLEFINSPFFDSEVTKEYQRKTQDALLQRKVFKLVEALEENMDVWSLGLNHYDVSPNNNHYIPVRHTIMPKPDLLDSKSDQLLYRFNDRKRDGESHTETRINPNAKLNPLKGYNMGPDFGETKKVSHNNVRGNKWSKWRRLSKIKNTRNFSTAIDRPVLSEEMEEAGAMAAITSMLPSNLFSNWSLFNRK